MIQKPTNYHSRAANCTEQGCDFLLIMFWVHKMITKNVQEVKENDNALLGIMRKEKLPTARCWAPSTVRDQLLSGLDSILGMPICSTKASSSFTIFTKISFAYCSS